ncbi:hypothetical protein BU23DRAFT_430493, partial [Bimuria novae-zelandiae CBS 107.79]
FSLGKKLTSLKINTIKIDIRLIIFYIINIPTPFLFYLKDIDNLGVYFNNITNKLVK